jgi:hypothetical protein
MLASAIPLQIVMSTGNHMIIIFLIFLDTDIKVFYCSLNDY